MKPIPARHPSWPKPTLPKTPRIDPAEFGLAVTICIAALSHPACHIVTVSDRRLSDLYDRVPARDDIAHKNLPVSQKWGLMFSGDARLWPEFFNEVGPAISVDSPNVDAIMVQDKCLRAYNGMVKRRLMAGYFGRLGFVSIDDFTQRGRAQLGGSIFKRYVEIIEDFNLGIEFIMYGFDPDNTPHLMTLEHPGIIADHVAEYVAVIGSGTTMARAVLHKRVPQLDLSRTIYGLLDAKFSSETASGVGKSTSLKTLNLSGQEGRMADREIDMIRGIWMIETKRPDPEKALETISQSFAVQGVREEQSA